MIWPAWQPEIIDVGVDDHHLAPEPPSQERRARLVELERDHPRARIDERNRHSAVTRADVKDE